MKKLTLFIAFLAIVVINVNAQKMMTRTGKVSFFSSTPMENIEAFNNDVASALNTANGEVMFVVPIKSFKFEKSLMQEHFNESYMESDQYPKADFKGTLTDLSAINFAKDGSYPAKVNGALTIHGVTKTVTLPGTITVKGKAVTMSAKFKVKTADYKIKIPSMTAGKIAQEIEITVNSILEAK